MTRLLVLLGLALFYLLFVGRSLQLALRGVKVWAIGSTAKTAREKLLEYALVPGLLLWTGVVLANALEWEWLPGFFTYSFFSSLSWLRFSGLLFCYGGLALFLWALVSFGNAWRIGLSWEEGGELVMTGAFSVSRNPIFLFMDAYFIGTAIIYRTPFLILFAVAAVLCIHRQILREEAALRGRFGTQYFFYCSFTPRYL